jgi:ABC-2 type transport system permease protein
MEVKMSKIGIVFKFELIRQLKKPSFWISLLLFPVAIFAVMGLSALSSMNIDSAIENQDFSDTKIGILDEVGIASGIASNFTGVTTADAGIAQVKNGELDIFYHIPADLYESNTIKVYDRAEDASLIPTSSITFASMLKAEAYQHIDPKDIAIIENTINYETIDFDKNGNPVNLLGRAVIPMAVLGIFYILICVFGNRLTMALVEEKENRISEMILTSISAKSLVIGKILSLIVLGFIQIAVFIIPIISALIIYRDNPMVSGILSSIEFDLGMIVGNVLLLLFSYFMFAGACTLTGSLVPTARDASQYIGIAMMGTVMPLFFMQSLIAGSPDIITYILSYFPLSAPIALMLRNAFGNLPTYELIIGIVDLAIASGVILTLTVKSFQKNAINFSVVKPHFGKRISWKRH